MKTSSANNGVQPLESLQSRLRPVDVARRTGCSVQQIRVLERDRVLPPATRTPSGYRIFTGVHVQAALAYRALAVAVDPVPARRIMRAVHDSPAATLYALLDAAHARLHAEREGLWLAKQAAQAITNEQLDDPRPADSMTISELADALGVRPSTLRHWEAESLISPARSNGRSRTYAPADVRDARIVHQLRQAGYRVSALKDLMPRLRQHQGWADISGALLAREATLNSRSRQLIRASALLDTLLEAPSTQG